MKRISSVRIGSFLFGMLFAAPALTAQTAVLDPTIVQQAYLKASNTEANDQFAFSISISGDTIVIGARLEDSAAAEVNGDQTDNSALSSGAAYVFVRNGTTWTQQAYLKASNPNSFDWFGWAVAISGDTIVIGAPQEDSMATGVNGDETDNNAQDAGAAYVFVRDGTNWTQQAYLKASNTDAVDQFGYDVAVAGDTIVIGAALEDSSATGINGNQSDNTATDSGAAYIFVRSGANWAQQAYLKASNTGAADDFGGDVTISGETVLIGAAFEDSSANGVNGDQSNNNAVGSGAAYVFVRNGTTWSQHAYLKASNTGAGDLFGRSVSVSGDTIVVSAPQEDSAATGVNGNQSDNSAMAAGAAYVFARNGASWSQQAYLKASNTDAGDVFGRSAAISGDTVLLGAHREDSNAVGVNGDQTDNSASDAGAAYVFVRNRTTWAQQAYLKSSNAQAGDQLGGTTVTAPGSSLALSGDTAVVAAWFEDSMGTGVNGDQSDDSAVNAGAAYVVRGVGPRPRLDIEADGSGGYLILFHGIPGWIYELQRATSAEGPWPMITTSAAPASGVVELHDPNPPNGQAFYRVALP
jgi:hypothetical protein